MQGINLIMILGIIVASIIILVSLKGEASRKHSLNTYLAHLRNDAKGTAKSNKKRQISWKWFTTVEMRLAIAVAFVCLFFVGFLQLSIWVSLLFIIISGYATWRFVKIYKLQKMRAEFADRFPEAVDSFTRAVQAGIPINKAFQSLGDIYPGELGKRFRNLIQQLDLGIPIREALETFSKNLNIAEVDFFCSVLSLNRETGSSLVPMLETLSYILRENKAVDRKLKALTAETRGAATVLCGMPVFVIGLQFFINPSQMMMVLNDPTGKVIFGYSIASMLVGFFVIKRMSNMME